MYDFLTKSLSFSFIVDLIFIKFFLNFVLNPNKIMLCYD